MIDAAILTLCLLAVMGAECIPLLLILTAAAGVLTVWKEIKRAAPVLPAPKRLRDGKGLPDQLSIPQNKGN